jgi:phage gpG-like protein
MLSTTIAVSPDLSAALEALKPAALKRAVARGMKRGTLLIAGAVQTERLTGKGPFPVAQQRLGVRSGRLRRSVRGTAPQIQGDTVTTSIGSNVKYAAAHEFGFKGTVTVKAHEVTIKKLFGRKLKTPLRFSRLAHQRNVTIPERRPFRTGIEASLNLIEDEITREVIKLSAE